MNARENYLQILRHGKGEWLPDGADVVSHIMSPVCERPMTRTGRDAFGVNWLYSNIQGFGCHYDPNQEPVISDIECWEKQLISPNLDIINWERIEEMYAAGPGSEEVWDVAIMAGPLERLTMVMPMEEALVNLVLETEAMKGILKRITDYKVDLIDRIAACIHPDSLTIHDDWGTEAAPFISLDMWREFIKPCMQRIYDAVKKHGIALIQHSCGKVEPFLEDIVDMGVDGWESYQSCNDLGAIKEKFGNRLVFVGEPDVRRFLAKEDQSDEAIEGYLRTLVELLRRGGGYLPDSGLGSSPGMRRR